MMRLSLDDELVHSMSSMKYVLNHPYKFVNGGLSVFVVSLIRVVINLLVEVVNFVTILS